MYVLTYLDIYDELKMNVVRMDKDVTRTLGEHFKVRFMGFPKTFFKQQCVFSFGGVGSYLCHSPLE